MRKYGTVYAFANNSKYLNYSGCIGANKHYFDNDNTDNDSNAFKR